MIMDPVWPHKEQRARGKEQRQDRSYSMTSPVLPKTHPKFRTCLQLMPSLIFSSPGDVVTLLYPARPWARSSLAFVLGRINGTVSLTQRGVRELKSCDMYRHFLHQFDHKRTLCSLPMNICYLS